ncbi:ubiquitin carboxyl-terminal hydrolase 30 isoform X1 [Petromyzon marinus]|uniref:ubiquitin carboxyl-terminal hydrolase 30 isoform X1 n=1 Tax=Petromyzon marinus TaxID=7757 RepID=UPI003F709CFF
MGVGWGEVWGLLGLAAVGVYVLWGPSTRTSRKKGLVPGLRNIGNACYLNALLQALATCAPLHAWLQGTDSNPGSEPEHGTNERMHNECHAHSSDARTPGPCHKQEEVTHGGDTDAHSIDAGFSGIKADARSNNTEAYGINTDTPGSNTDTHSIDTDTQQMNTDTLDTNTEAHGINTETHGINTEAHGINTETHGNNIVPHGIITDTQQIDTETPSINTETHGINANAYSTNTDSHSDSTQKTDAQSINTDTDDLHTDRYSNNKHNTDTGSMNNDTHDVHTYSTDKDTGSTVTHNVNVHETNGNGTNPDSMNTDVRDGNTDGIDAGIQSIETQSSGKNTDNDGAHSADLDARTMNVNGNSKDSDRHRLNTDTRNNNADTETNSTDTYCVDTRNTDTGKGGIDTEAHGNNIATRVIGTDAHSADTDAHNSQTERYHANVHMHSSDEGRHDTSTGTHRTNTHAHSSDTYICDVNTDTGSAGADARTNVDIEDKNIATRSRNTDARHTSTDIHCNDTDRRHTSTGTHAIDAPASSSFESVASEVGEDPGLGCGRFIVRRSSDSSAREGRAPSGHLHSALLGMLRVLMGEGDAADAPVHAGPVLEALRSHGWEIPAHQEQDAHELFAVVMTTLEEERQGRSSLAFFGLQLQRLPMLESAGVVNRVTGGLHVPLAKTRVSPFLGRFAITLQCTRCKHKGPVRLESFESISLPIPPNKHAPSVPLELCLESFFRSELLTGVKCDACSQTHPAGASIQADFLKRTLLAKLPQCVCIHLHRLAFSRDAHAYKEHGHVSFRSSLDLARYTLRSELSKGRVGHCGSWFTLTAVVVHYGNSTSGHFVTYRSIPSGGRAVRGRWVCCSDDEVRSVSLSEVLNSRAYLLFYTRT